MRFESDASSYLRHNNRTTLNNPTTFHETTNLAIWLTQLEIFLENCCTKEKWFENGLSYISPTCLSELHSIDELRKQSDNYNQLKEFLRKKYMVKNKIKKADLADFVNRRQSPNESIRQYAEALERLALVPENAYK